MSSANMLISLPGEMVVTILLIYIIVYFLVVLLIQLVVCWTFLLLRYGFTFTSSSCWINGRCGTLSKALLTSKIQHKPLADAGFIEGGFCSSIACEKFGATPTFAENHVHFRAFLREASCPTCQSLHFRSRSLLRHAEVSHRS